jgi:hypothetical protein
MEKRFSILVGAMLIVMGVLSLAFNLAAPALGLNVWRWGAWRLWPLTVVSVGLLFVLSPLLAAGNRSLGALFIPGVPILTTGGILLFTSVFAVWGAWAWLWPLEVLGVAVGFLFAAIYMRVIWLLIPAIIVGANGLVLHFCAVTGLWEAWAVLWTIEPLSAGLSFLIISAKTRSTGFFAAGLIICSVAGVGMIGMTAVFPWWWLTNLAGPAVLVLVGVLVLLSSTTHRPLVAEQAVGEPAEAAQEMARSKEQEV